MRSYRWLIIAALGVGWECSPSQTPAESTVPDPVAHYDGGQLSFADVERRMSTARTPACRLARQRRGGGAVDALIPCYRELAERLAIERLILAEVPDLEKAIEGLGERYYELRQRAFLNPYFRRLLQDIEVSDEEVAAHFEANRERYRRAKTLTLWNIYRRHQDPTKAEETLELLRRLKERFLAGETFAALAREHSHSETRLRDGLVGSVTEGRLPERLEQIAFALADGEVSDPVTVSDGAILLHVRHGVEGSSPSLDEVQQRIRQELRGQKQQERIQKRTAARKLPADATALSPKGLIAALDSDDADRVVFEIGHVRITVAQFRQQARLASAAEAADLDEETRQALLDTYQAQVTRQKLVLELLDSAEASLREEAEEQLESDGGSALVEEQLRTEVWKLIDSDPELLRLFYDDNRPHYQTPLRFKLHTLDLPLDEDVPKQLERLEQLRGALMRGELEPAAAAARVGGEFRALDWVAFDDLAELLPDKAHKYLLQLETEAEAQGDRQVSGFSVPYHQDEALHLLWVEERQEPQPLPYEEVDEQVREDYFERFQQELSTQVLTTRLNAANFVFDEEKVRLLLLPDDEPAPAGSASQSRLDTDK